MKKVWYVLSVALLLTALIFGGAMSAAADTADAIGGACGANVTWAYANNVLTISGEGAMGDYDTSFAPWRDYKDQIEKIVIGKDVTTVGMAAFRDFTNLTTVTFGTDSALTAIGAGAFFNCAALEEIAIPSNVTEIGSWAFGGCVKLDTVTLPTGLISVGESAFQGCASLTAVHFANNLEQIGSGVFRRSGVATIDFCGTQEEWNAIEKPSWDDGMNVYKVNYLHEAVDYIDEVDDTYHQYKCGKCNYKSPLISHNLWDDGVIKAGDEATHTETGTMTYTCACGATKEEIIERTPDHVYGDWMPYDATSHQKVCGCGDVIYEDHNWDGGIVTTEPTVTTTGVKTYTCTVETCGATKTEDIPFIHTDYGDWEPVDDNWHSKKCACGMDTIFEEHNWKVEIEEPTHTKPGVKTYTCKDCGREKTELVPQTASHSYADAWSPHDANRHKKACDCGDVIYEDHKWDTEEITKEATHTETGVMTYTCACGATKEEIIERTPDHVYGDWMPYDATSHQKVCDYDGNTVLEEHKWDGGKITTPATHTKEGVKTYTCACGATKTEAIKPTPTHVYKTLRIPYDADFHKKVCDCGQTEFEKHTWEVIKFVPHTHVSIGEITYKCAGCNDEKKEVISAGHSYGDWEYYNEAQHKKTCSDGDDTVYAAHKWDGGKITTQATHTEDGLKTYTCSDCGGKKYEMIPKDPYHIYIPDQWDPHYENGKLADWHEQECVCGEVGHEEHTWDEGVVEEGDEATHFKQGKKTYTCTVCKGQKFETLPKLEEHTYTASYEKYNADQHKAKCECGKYTFESHEWDSGKVTTPATHTAEGVKTYTCKECGETKTEKIAKTDAHKFDDAEWEYHNKASHKRVCECGAAEEQAHDWDDGTVVTEATKDAEGKIEYACKVCGHKKSEAIPVLVAGCNYTIAGGVALMLLLSIGAAGLVFKKKKTNS